VSTGSGEGSVLALDGVSLPARATGALRRTFDLELAPGALVVVDAGGPETERIFVDVVLGLEPPAAGRVRVLGQDWSRVPADYGRALRGRIGLVPHQGGWLGHLPTATNVLLRPRFHRRTPDAALVEEARTLAAAFLLPGLPLDPIGQMHPRDRLRTACVRAFVGEPALVVVETPFETAWGTLLPPLVASIQTVRERGGVVLWCLTDDPLFDDPVVPADLRLRLRDVPARREMA
jgi:phospholipid/cholesterol/gamma-HCH transport system ATP-binding protein